jgi:hypothetical protein
MWDGARPGLRGRREGRDPEVREPDRKESSGRGVRDDLLLVAWQPFLFSWQNCKILLNSIYYASFLVLQLLNDRINSLSGLEIVPPENGERVVAVTRKKSLRISVLTFQVRAKERESGEWDKRKAGERRDGRKKRDQNTVQLTHLNTGPPRPFTCWCDMEVLESCM